MSKPDAAALIAAAEKAMRQAYAKYSGFQVGAAVLTARGGVFVGCNVENVSSPLGICAERSAIAAAVAAEGPSMRLDRLVVTAQSGGVPQTCTPCGACRQVIQEFGPDATVLYRGADLQLVSAGVRELLPQAFAIDPRARAGR
jgi:cytidine deaminase